jgi:hypothetical protein
MQNSAITIHDDQFGNNKCWICYKPFHHHRHWNLPIGGELPEQFLRVTHRSCEKLVREIEKQKEKLVCLEFELFCKQSNCFNF